MKNALATLLLALPGIAGAGTFTAAPLKGYTLCPATALVMLSDDGKYMAASYYKEVERAARAKLTAYRVLGTSSKCDALSAKTAYILIAISLTKPINDNARAYHVETDIFTFDNANGGSITLWNSERFGVTARSVDDLKNLITIELGKQIDNLAADYAIVNR